MGLKLPAIQTSELTTSILNRVVRFNGLPGIHQLCTSVLGNTRVAKNNPLVSTKNLVLTTSVLYGLSQSAVIQRHTLLPFRNAFKRHHATNRGDFGLDFGRTTQDVAREHASGTRFCRKCVHEDKAAFGFSYVRRQHQLSAIVRCRVHDEWLVEAGSECWSALPSDRSSLAKKDAQQLRGSESALAARFHELTDVVLNLRTPISHSKISRQMRLKLGIKGRPEQANGYRSRVDALLRNRPQQDINWVQSTLGSLRCKGGNDPKSQLARSLNGEMFFTTPVLTTLMLVTPNNLDAQQLLSSIAPSSSSQINEVIETANGAR